MLSPLRMYDAGLRAGGGAPASHIVHLRDGTRIRLALERYLGPADAADERILDGLDGPVLDVGCGPGRHLRALARRGVFALGLDLSPVAVELAVGAGARAMVGNIFDELPDLGKWRSALLLDGNIGIGGEPVRLLSRIGALLQEGGQLLVEVEPYGTPTCCTEARLEHRGTLSSWFPWARVAAPAIASIGRRAGFRTVEIRPVADRWFARLRYEPAPVGGRRRSLTAPSTADGSVP